jgi:hypothetical protein
MIFHPRLIHDPLVKSIGSRETSAIVPLVRATFGSPSAQSAAIP